MAYPIQNLAHRQSLCVPYMTAHLQFGDVVQRALNQEFFSKFPPLASSSTDETEGNEGRIRRLVPHWSPKGLVLRPAVRIPSPSSSLSLWVKRSAKECVLVHIKPRAIDPLLRQVFVDTALRYFVDECYALAKRLAFRYSWSCPPLRSVQTYDECLDAAICYLRFCARFESPWRFHDTWDRCFKLPCGHTAQPDNPLYPCKSNGFSCLQCLRNSGCTCSPQHTCQRCQWQGKGNCVHLAIVQLVPDPSPQRMTLTCSQCTVFRTQHIHAVPGGYFVFENLARCVLCMEPHVH